MVFHSNNYGQEGGAEHLMEMLTRSFETRLEVSYCLSRFFHPSDIFGEHSL